MTQRSGRASLVRAALILALVCASSASLFALEVPAAPSQWFTDNAHLLGSTDGDALNRKLQSFEQSSGAQFIIYTFPSLGGEALEDFTIRCAEKWKVGNKKYDNGLILFVFAAEKKVRIEVGYGLEPTVTDAFSSDVISNEIRPNFQKANYSGGLNAAADALIDRISHKNAAVAPVRTSGSSGLSGNASPGCSDIIIVLVLIAVFVTIVVILPRRGGCGGCFWPGFFLGGGGGTTFGGGGWGGGGGGGFSGGGGGFGGGGASGGW